MTSRLIPLLAAIPAIVFVAFLMGFDSLQTAPPPRPPVGQTAQALLNSPVGDDMGTVSMLQRSSGIFLTVNMQGLPPGRHGLSVRSSGTCAPYIEAVGDKSHLSVDSSSLVHDGWKRGNRHLPQNGDLPDIFAGAGGPPITNADTGGPDYADFNAVDILLGDGGADSILGSNSSSVTSHTSPDQFHTTLLWSQ